MRKLATLFFFVVTLVTANIVHAQAPEAFKYQAVVRDTGGVLLANQPIGIRSSIVADSANGTTVYQETHTINSNGLGLISLQIGAGMPVVGTLGTIDWGAGPYFTKIEMDKSGGTNYLPLVEAEMLSVPYALYAENVANDAVDDADADPSNEIQDISLAGTDLSISSGSTINLAVLQDGTTDADADPTNELQTWATLPGIPSDIADGDAVNDADSNPSNELQTISLSGSDLSISAGNTINLSSIDTDTDNQTLSLSGGILTISGGNTADLNSLSDNDWYVGNTASTIPSNIGSNIYTNGNVGIGVMNPPQRLSVYRDTDASSEIGRAHIGYMGHSNWAGFSHVDMNASGSYALMQNQTGQTLLNAANGQDIIIRNNNVNQAVFESDGDFGVGTIDPASKVEVVGDVRLNGNTAGIIYQNKETNKDWRLIYADGFEADVEGWIANQSLSTGDLGMTRQSMNVAGLVGHFIRPNNNNHTLKKQFNTSGLAFSEVKVEFNYIFLDSWDGEIGWLGVKGSEAGSPTPIWYKIHNHDNSDLELNGTTYNVSFYGNGSWSDIKYKGQAQFSWSGAAFWIEFGANLDGNTGDETFGIDNVMIYVR